MRKLSLKEGEVKLIFDKLNLCLKSPWGEKWESTAVSLPGQWYIKRFAILESTCFEDYQVLLQLFLF